MQLAGPVPAALYHRYVEFKPFIAGMFTATSLRGWILNRALHHQHSRVYNFDRHTVYGSFPSPCRDMTLKFLELAHFDKGGRIFTYVITLDGHWRFTETGKEFGIDLLSKHTMHSDVNIYIAFSGEFFIRRHQHIPHPHKENEEGEGSTGEKPGPNLDAQPTHPPDEIEGGPPDSDPPQEPEAYTLVIDNDSGTYRPNAKLLPQLKEYMQKQLPGLHIITLDCNGDKEKMDKWKGEQRSRKKSEGKGLIVRQQSSSSVGSDSISSSDEEDLEEQAASVNADTQNGGHKEERGLKEKVEAKMERANEKLRGSDEDEKCNGDAYEAEGVKHEVNGSTHPSEAAPAPAAAPAPTGTASNGDAKL